MSFKNSAIFPGKSLIRQVTQMQTKSRISMVDRPVVQSRVRALSTISDYEDPKILTKQDLTTSLKTEVEQKKPDYTN